MDENVQKIIEKYEKTIKEVIELLSSLESEAKSVSQKLKRKFEFAAVLDKVYEGVYNLESISEIGYLILEMIQRIEGFKVPFIFFENGYRWNSLILDDSKREFVENLFAGILSSSEDPFNSSNIFEKSLDSGLRILAVPLYEEGLFRGMIGVLSYEIYQFDKEDKHFFAELSRALTIALRQKLNAKKLEEANIKLKDTLWNSIRLVQKIIDLKDPHGSVHGQNVADLAKEIALRLGMEEERIDYLVYAAMIHDVGKIALPTEILLKPGPISELEYNLVKLHPAIAYEFLMDMSFPYSIAEIVLQHHERLDGSGYPKGLKGDEILLETKILSVCEVVEAMTHFRPWRDPVPLEEALGYLEKNKGVLFDAEIVEICKKVFQEGFTFKA